MESTDDLEERYESEATRVRDLIQAGELDEAEQILRSLPMGTEFCTWLHEKSDVFLNLAKARLNRGQIEATKAILATVEPDVATLATGGRWEAADCYLEMAKIMDALGDSASWERFLVKAADRARQHEYTDVDCRKILAEVARRFAAREHLDQARSTALLISYRPIRQITLEDIGMRDASEVEGLKAFCPKCGVEMKARFDGDRLVEACCEKGSMDFSRAVAAEVSREFFEDSSGRDVTKPLYAPSLWYCPRDGAQMWQSDRMTYTCTTCGRDLNSRMLWSLVELHPHS